MFLFKGEMNVTMAMLQSKKVHLERDEFELEEIAYALSEAKEEGKMKVFIVHQQQEPLTGMVIKMDANTKLIHIQNEAGDVYKVHFLDILEVLSAE